jgi:hypothetical protein
MVRAGLAFVAALLCAACSQVDEDWLMSEVPSPDGLHVARLWCEHLCHVPGNLTLTVSPASRVIARTPSPVSGFPPAGQMPDEDVAGHFSMPGLTSGAQAVMGWSDGGSIDISAPCIIERGPSGGPMKVVLRKTGSCDTQ